MKRLLAVIPALLLSSAALSQEAPEAAYKDLWCGLAFTVAGSDAPYTPEDLAAAQAAGDAATDEQRFIIEHSTLAGYYVPAGQGLVDRAGTAYKAAGFTDETFEAERTTRLAAVVQQVTTSPGEAEFSFDDCATLVPPPAAAQ